MYMNLSVEQRNYFSLVREGAFVNPFSAERLGLFQRMADLPVERDMIRLLPAIKSRLKSQLEALELAGARKLKDFDAAHRDLMRHVYLFHIYTTLEDKFDHWIERQSRLPEQTDPVPFAADALAAMRSRGLTADQAGRYFAVFYQLRRGFYFIDRGLLGPSDCMRQLRMHLWNSVFTRDILLYDEFLWSKMEDFSTMLLGPTGAGKGAAAAAIGRSGFIPFDAKTGRFKDSFMRVYISANLSQYPETLLESALFGHTKGSFTGALSDHDGLFARCSPYGSVFLDEIGDVSIPVQIKLLQVLEERCFTPLGTYKSKRFAGRVIAATNRPLDRLRREGAFRDDFFYRLCSDVIHVPSLRQRIAEDPQELEVMVGHVVGAIVGHPEAGLAKSVLEIIRQQLGEGYPWRGNVRELAQCVRRILLKRRYEPDRSMVDGATESWLARVSDGTLTARELLSHYCAMLYGREGSYERVGAVTGLDRRTVKKYVDDCKDN